MVDGEGEGLVELAERIVRERSEMNDGVDGIQVGMYDVPDILPDLRRSRGGQGMEVTAFVQAGIEPDDGMAGGLEYTARDGADVSAASCEENAHSASSYGRVCAAQRDELAVMAARDPSPGETGLSLLECRALATTV